MAKKTKDSGSDTDTALVPTESVDRRVIVDLADSAQEAISLVQDVDQSWLRGVEFEQLIVLDAGKGIEGVFLGAGPVAEVTDPVTGDLRPVGTWRFALTDHIIVRLLSSVRLSAEFTTPHGMDKHPRLGQKCRIAKIGMKQSKRGRNVNDYFIGWLFGPK